MKYRAFDRAVESDEPLPELPSAHGSGEPRFRVSWHAPIRWPSGLRWHRLWSGDGTDGGVAIARRGGTSFLRFDGVATAAIDRGRIALAPDPWVDPEAVRHALLDQILPLALAAEGETVLHASAVEADGAALLLLGGAGSGKSTLAAALSARGACVLADDGVLLERRGEDVWAVPSYRGLRLWPDAASSAGACGFSRPPRRDTTPIATKYRLVPADRDAGALSRPLAAAYSLGPGASIAFARLSRRDAALEFVRHTFMPDVQGRTAVVARLDRAASWSGRLQIWRLDAPRDFAFLPQLARAVLAHAGACAASVRLQGQ